MTTTITKKKPAKKKRAKKKTGLAAMSPQEISPSGLILFFSATWCQPCQTLKRILAKRKLTDLVEVIDLDANEARAATLGVSCVPMLIRPDGSVYKGLGPEAEMLAFLKGEAIASSACIVSLRRDEKARRRARAMR